MDTWRYAAAGLLAPLFWAALLAVLLWLTRRFLPRRAETLLFGDGRYAIGWLAGRAVRLLRQAARAVASLLPRKARAPLSGTSGPRR